MNTINSKNSSDSLTTNIVRVFKRIILIFIVYVILYQIWVFMHIWWWVDHNPTSTAFMKDRLKTIQQEKSDAKLKFEWINYNQLSRNLKKAVVASEDAKFVQHDGFDWDGIELAFNKNLKKGKIVAGGSTISQQLAKNLFLSGKRTPWRKLQEAVITVMLEKMMDKKRIFEIYLNVIEWGNGVFGAQAASKHYFHKGAASLSAEQAAKLAVMIPNPRFYDNHRSTRFLNKRLRSIKARMRSAQIP